MEKAIPCLILDDEELLRELLKRTIAWAELGLELTAEASSAMEALDLIEETAPELLIVDICIPVMNGIDFSTRVLQQYPHMKIVILTGHDEFDYARQSLRIGVSDFLLKPLNPEELNQTLTEACRSIRANKRELKEQAYLKRQLEINKPYLRERFLNTLVRENLPDPELQNTLAYYGIRFTAEDFQAALLEPAVLSSGGSEEERLLLQAQAIEYICRFINREQALHIFRGETGELIIINNNKEHFETAYYETIKENLRKTFDCSVTIGVGEAKKGIEKLPESYREAEKALKYKLIEGKNSVIAYSDLPHTAGACGDLLTGLSDFSFYLNAGMAAEAETEVTRLLEEQCPAAVNDIAAFQITAVNVLARIVNALREQSLDFTVLEYGLMELYNRLLVIDTLPEMRRFLFNLIRRLTAAMAERHSRQTGKLISDIKEFLGSNYADSNLNLNLTAHRFHVNSSYLSRKFKEETGQSFIDYLSRLRMNRAVTLLRDTDNRNYQIAEMVGIADPHYFSLFFKKHMGMSITEYRQSLDK